MLSANCSSAPGNASPQPLLEVEKRRERLRLCVLSLCFPFPAGCAAQVYNICNHHP